MSETEPTDQRKLVEQALRRLREMKKELAEAQRGQIRRQPIAIVGAAVRAPGEVDQLDTLWAALRSGVDAITPQPEGADGRRPPPGERVPNGRWAGLLSRVDGFDAGFFGISPVEAAYMDPQQRILLETAWEAVEDAGMPIERLRERRTGVFIGIYGSDYLNLQLGSSTEITAYTAPGGAHSIAANRLSYLFDLLGPSMTVDTACSSSLVAVHLACRALHAGDCDFALVGGVNVILSESSTILTEKVLPMAPGGRCRTFDSSADGIVRAEGCGMLLLEREADALSHDQAIRGVIRGTAVNHDGRTNGLTAPSPKAQAELLRLALADAGADPQDVVYIEAHGTGTRLGDPIEIEALREVYGQGEVPCAVGSVKTQFGHQEAAAGITGLLKAMLVLEHGQVPPHLHLRQLNPEINLDGTRLMVLGGGGPLPDVPSRLAAVSSFGFGGTNAHAILAPPPPPPREPCGPPAATPDRFILPLSARAPGALAEMARRYTSLLYAIDSAEAIRACAAAAVGRTHHRYRLCISADDRSGLVAQLRAVRAAHIRPSAAPAPRIGFVFSGQGSQWPAMGRELMATEPVVQSEVAECDAIVSRLAGWSVIEQLETAGRDSRLDETEAAQVSIGVLQLGLVALWRSWGIEPSAVVGHSMGEIVAATAAGAFGREAALKLLLDRARLTEQGALGGSMLSVALSGSQVAPLLAGGEGRISIGAVNGPRSTIVSGDGDAVKAVEAEAARLGVISRRLPVKYAFHSPLLESLAGRLAVAAPQSVGGDGDIAFYSTVTGDRTDMAELDGRHWVRNLRDQVEFYSAVQAMLRDGITAFVEIGPHPSLLRNLGEITEESGRDALAVGSLRRDQPLWASLYRSLGQLYEAGLHIRWDAVNPAPASGYRLPTYPWQRTRHWLVLTDRPAATVPEVGLSPVPRSEPTAPIPADAAAGGYASSTAAAGARSTEDADFADAVLTYVRDQIAAAKGLRGAALLPIDQRLYELDSIVIVELKNQIERHFGITVPLQALLGADTPLLLAKVIIECTSARNEAR